MRHVATFTPTHQTHPWSPWHTTCPWLLTVQGKPVPSGSRKLVPRITATSNCNVTMNPERPTLAFVVVMALASCAFIPDHATCGDVLRGGNTLDANQKVVSLVVLGTPSGFCGWIWPVSRFRVFSNWGHSHHRSTWAEHTGFQGRGTARREETSGEAMEAKQLRKLPTEPHPPHPSSVCRCPQSPARTPLSYHICIRFPSPTLASAHPSFVPCALVPHSVLHPVLPLSHGHPVSHPRPLPLPAEAQAPDSSPAAPPRHASGQPLASRCQFVITAGAGRSGEDGSYRPSDRSAQPRLRLWTKRRPKASP